MVKRTGLMKSRSLLQNKEHTNLDTKSSKKAPPLEVRSPSSSRFQQSTSPVWVDNLNKEAARIASHQEAARIALHQSK